MNASTAAGAISVNGEVFAPGLASVPAMDHGFLFGDSVYEVVRTHGGRPVAMQPHLERLRASGEQIYFEVPWSDGEIRRIARRTVDATQLVEQYVRIVVTRGPGPMSLLPDGCAKATLLVYVFPLQTPGPDVMRDGITIVVPDRIRNDPGALAPSAKTGNYLNNLLALVEARRQGGADAVMVGADGHVTEATTANVWWVRNGVIYTPSLESGILPGITRSLLIPAVNKLMLRFFFRRILFRCCHFWFGGSL